MFSGHTFGAALGDIAVAQAAFLCLAVSVPGVQRMHFEFGDSHQEAAGERILVFLVIANYVRRFWHRKIQCTCGTPASVQRRLAPFGTRWASLGWRERRISRAFW